MRTQCRAVAWDLPNANCCVLRAGHDGPHVNTFGNESERWAETEEERDDLRAYQMQFWTRPLAPDQNGKLRSV